MTREGQDVLDGSSSGSGGPGGVVEGNPTECAGSGYRTYNLELPCG
ncbi:hypothetical protein [Streptomyces sp. NPDC001401]